MAIRSRDVDAATWPKLLAAAGEPTEAAPVAFGSEREFQDAVQDFAIRNGWKRQYHTRDSRKSAAGFPDLVLVRERVVWAELKMDGSHPTADQLNWIDDLRAAGQEVYLWRPSDWDAITSALGSAMIQDPRNPDAFAKSCSRRNHHLPS